MSEGVATPAESDRLHTLIRTQDPTGAVGVNQPQSNVSGAIDDLRYRPDDLSQSVNKHLDDYTATSDFQVGDDLRKYVHRPPNDPSEREAWDKKSRATSGRDLARESARQSYYELPEETAEQTKNVFIGILQQEVGRINNQSTTDWFNRSIGTPEGESNLLGEFYDYVINNPSASKDLVEFYRSTNLIKDKTYVENLEAPVGLDTLLQARDADLADSIMKDYESPTYQPMRSHVQTYLSEKGLYSPSTEFKVQQDILNYSRKHLRKYRDQVEISDSQVRNVRLQLLSSLGQFGDTDTNYLIVSMNPSEIAEIKRATPLKSLPVESYLEALMITPASLHSIQNKNNLMQKWGELGLSRDQQTTLRHLLINGPSNTASPTIHEMGNESNNQVDAEQAVLKYLEELEQEYAFAGKDWPPSGALALPDRLKNDYLTNEFLIKYGFEPTDSRNIIHRALAGAWGGISDGFGWAIGKDETVADNIAKNAFGDPDFSVFGQSGRGIVFDPFKEEFRRNFLKNHLMPVIGGYLPTPDDYRAGMTGFSKEQLTAMVEEAEKAGASKTQIAQLRAAQTMTWVEHGVVDTIFTYVDGFYENFIKRFPNWASKGVLPTDKLPTFDTLGWSIERFREYIPGQNTVLDRYPELKQFNPFTSYETVQANRLREDSKNGGSIRRDLSAIYLATEYPDRHQIEDAVAGLLELDLDDNKQFYMANAIEFIDLVHNQGMSVPEALDEVLTLGQRMRAGFQFGLLNVLDVGSMGAKPLITGTTRGLTKTPRLRSGAAEVLGALQIIKDTKKIDLNNIKLVEETIEALDNRILILQNQVDNGIDDIVIKHPKKKDQFVQVSDLVVQDEMGLGSRVVNNVGGKLTVAADQIPDLTKTQQELDELIEIRGRIVTRGFNIDDWFGLPDETLELRRLGKDILELDEFTHLGDAITRTDMFIKQGDQFRDLFKIRNVLKAKLKVASMDPTDLDNYHGAHEIVTLSDVINPLSRLAQTFTGATWDGPVRDAIARRAFNTVNELTNFLTALGPRFEATATEGHQGLIRDMLRGINNIGGKKDIADPYENLQFLVNSQIDNVLYQDTQKALHILRQVDLKKIPSLLAENNVNTRIADGKTSGKWWAEFNEEMKAEVTRIMFKEYGMDPDNAKLWLEVQNGLNSFISKLFLERPAFAARNWITNKSLMALDGLSLSEAFLTQESYYRRVWGDVEFASKAFSKSAIGETLSGAVPIRGETNWYKVALGQRNEKVIAAKGMKKFFLTMKGGGIPFIGGGLPFIHARELSGLAEATDRMRIIDKAGARWYRQLATEESIKNLLRTQYPDAWRILGDTDLGEDGKLLQQIIESMQNPANVSMDQVIRTVEDIEDTSRILLETMISPKQLFRDLGFNPAHMADLDLDRLVSKLLRDFDVHSPSSPFTPTQRLIKAIDDEIAELTDTSRIKGISAGFIPNGEFNTHALRALSAELIVQGDARLFPNDILDLPVGVLERDIFTNLLTLWPRYFEEAKVRLAGEGNAPTEEMVKRAEVLASQAVFTIAKPLRAVEELKSYLKLQLQNPSLHKETNYGWVRKLTGLSFDMGDKRFGSTPISGEMATIFKSVDDIDEAKRASMQDHVTFEMTPHDEYMPVEYLPEQLYHATTNATAVTKNAILTKGKANAMGGSEDAGISLTDNFEIANNIATTYKRTRQLALAKPEDVEKILLSWRDQDLKVLTAIERYNLNKIREKGGFTQAINAILNPNIDDWFGLRVWQSEHRPVSSYFGDEGKIRFDFDELANLTDRQVQSFFNLTDETPTGISNNFINNGGRFNLGGFWERGGALNRPEKLKQFLAPSGGQELFWKDPTLDNFWYDFNNYDQLVNDLIAGVDNEATRRATAAMRQHVEEQTQLFAKGVMMEHYLHTREQLGTLILVLREGGDFSDVRKVYDPTDTGRIIKVRAADMSIDVEGFPTGAADSFIAPGEERLFNTRNVLFGDSPLDYTQGDSAWAVGGQNWVDQGDDPLHSLTNPFIVNLRGEYKARDGGVVGFMKKIRELKESDFEVIHVNKNFIPSDAAVKIQKGENLREYDVHSTIPVGNGENKRHGWYKQAVGTVGTDDLTYQDNLGDIVPFMPPNVNAQFMKDLKNDDKRITLNTIMELVRAAGNPIEERTAIGDVGRSSVIKSVNEKREIEHAKHAKNILNYIRTITDSAARSNRKLKIPSEKEAIRQVKQNLATRIRGITKDLQTGRYSQEAKNSVLDVTLTDILLRQFDTIGPNDVAIRGAAHNAAHANIRLNAEGILNTYFTKGQRKIFTEEDINLALIRQIEEGRAIKVNTEVITYQPVEVAPSLRIWKDLNPPEESFIPMGGVTPSFTKRKEGVPQSATEAGAWWERAQDPQFWFNESTEGQREYRRIVNNDTRTDLQRAEDDLKDFGDPDKLLDVPYDQADMAAWKPETTPALEEIFERLGYELSWMAEEATKARLSSTKLKEDILNFETQVNEQMATAIREALEGLQGLGTGTQSVRARGNQLINELTSKLEVTVNKLINATQEDDKFVGYNTILKELGIDDAREVTLGKLTGSGERSMSTADRMGKNIWHDDDNDVFANWLTNTAPKLAFLRKFRKQAMEDLQQGAQPDSISEKFIDTIRAFDVQQAQRHSGMHLDTELDEAGLSAAADDLIYLRTQRDGRSRRALEELTSPELRPDEGIHSRGLPRYNTWADFLKFNFDEVLETNVSMSHAVGSNYFTNSSKTFSKPTRTLVYPRGATEEVKKSTILSPATQALDTLRGTRTAGIVLTEEARILYNQRTGKNIVSGERVKWYLPDGKNNMEFDETSAVLPANYGMPTHVRDDKMLVEGSPPQGVHGRVFMQKTPQFIGQEPGYAGAFGAGYVQEYVAVITDDSWPVEARRMAIFIKKGSSEADIEKEVMALARYTKKTKKRRKQIGLDFRMTSRSDHNWTGFRTSWSGTSGGTGLMDPANAQAELRRVIDEIEGLADPEDTKGTFKKFVSGLRKSGLSEEEADRERGIRRRALINVVNYMQEQWEKGWPIYGTTNDTLEDILPLFIREQRIFENSRASVINRGLRSGLQDPSVSPVTGLDITPRQPLKSYSTLSKEDGESLTRALKGLEKETNSLRKTAGALGRANADWILHDYSNTNNLDYILRWIGPWHIWQTRTTGKLAATLVDHPHLLNQFTAFQQTMREINRESDASSWTGYDLPIGQMAQPFYGLAKASGLNAGGWVDAVESNIAPKGATMNIDAFMFWNDMFDYYPSGGRSVRDSKDPTLAGDDQLRYFDEYSKLGKAADVYAGVLKLPINPLFTAGLSLSGAFGEDIDKTEKVIGSLTRPADATLGWTTSLFGKHTKTQVIRTNRDLREIDWMYFNTAMQEVMRNGPHIENNPKLKLILMSYDMWSRKKNDPLINVPLLSVIGASSGDVFGNELAGNNPAIDPLTGEKLDSTALANTHAEVVSAAASRRAQRDTWSMLVGMAVNVPYPTVVDPKTGYKTDAGNIMQEYYSIVQNRSMSTAQKTEAYDELFNQHPYVRNYLNNKKFESAPIKTAQATSMFYSGLDDLNLVYEQDLEAIPDRVPVPSSPIDARRSIQEEAGLTDQPMDNFTFFGARAEASERRRRTTQELKVRIFNSTGVNTGIEGEEYGEIHPAFAVDKRSFGDVGLFREMHKENLLRNDMFMTLFKDDPMAGVIRIETVLDSLFPDGRYRAVSREDVEDVIEEFAQEKLDRKDQEYPREYITVDMFNAWQLESYMQMLRKDKWSKVPPLFSQEFRDLYTIRGTNATNWNEYYEDLEAWETKIKSDDPEAFRAFQIYEASTADMDYIVDKAIENVMRSTQETINAAYELGRGNAIATARQVQHIEDTWNKPTVENVLEWLRTNEYGDIWLNHNEYSEVDLVSQIKKRLTTVEDITFEDMRDGKYEEKIAKLARQLDLDVPFKEQYHFLSPNKERTIHNAETLDDFVKAYEVYRLLDFAKENNVNMYLNPTEIDVHTLYYEYFVNGSETKKAQAAALHELYEDGNYEEAAQLKEKFKQRNTSGWPLGAIGELPEVASGNMPPSEFSVSEGGFPSTGASAYNINRNYQLFDLGQHPTLSSEGRKIKSYHTSRYYESNQEIPGDFIFETFGRNGVASREDVIDMWESIYPEMRALYGEALNHPSVLTLLAMTDSNGKAKEDASIATYWYIDALADVVASAVGIKSINRRPVRTVVQTRKSSIPSSASSRVTTPSTSGAGGLPTWAEVTRHMTMVFHDNELEQSVINFFMNPSKTLTNNHQRMLRAMYRTFPIGSGYTFEQWLQALKLIYQTKMLIGGSSNNYQSSGRNQYFQYPSNTPRMAKYRD